MVDNRISTTPLELVTIMIKRLLLPLDPSPYTDAALKFAIRIAKHYDAEITGLVILDIPGIEKSIGPVPLGAIHYAEQLEKEKSAIAEKHIEELLSNFSKICSQNQVKYKEANLQGSPSERILAESIYFDAVVMGLRTYFHFETQVQAGDSLAKILDHSVTPIYAIPKNYELPNFEDRKLKVLITISEPLSSARAIQRFVQVAEPDRSDIFIIVEAKDENTALFHMNETEKYLKTHNFRIVSKEWTSRSLIDEIDEKYLGKTDVIVIGNDTKRGLFSFSINDVANSMIKLNRVPLLIG